MAVRIYLMRHGLTPWNYESRFQGNTDIELSPEGIKQAKALQGRLTTEKLDAIYSSDLTRALQTAEIVAKPHGLEVRTKPGLREIHFGVWEGLTYKDLEREYPQELKTWLEAPHLLAVPQGETFAMLQDRAIKCLREILAFHPHGNIAVVAHGGTIAALICGLLQEPLAKMWNYRQKNTALNVLKWEEGRVSVELLNDSSHLENVV